MNKRLFRELHTDLKAAARLGQTDALDAALDGLRRDPSVAANHNLDAAYVQRWLLPLGEALALPTVPSAYPRTLLTSPYAAIRAVGAAALGARYARKAAGPKELQSAAKDPREEVRLALQLALSAAPPDRLHRLVSDWLDAPSPRQQALALHLLSVLPPATARPLLPRLTPLSHSDHSLVLSALAEALATLAHTGHAAAVLETLRSWAARPSPPLGVICRALSHPWAATHAAEAHALLDDLARRYGQRRMITNALRALERYNRSLQE